MTTEESAGRQLLRWLSTAVLFDAAIATVLLALAPGASWVRSAVMALLLVTIPGVLFWWGGFQHGRRRRSPR